METEKINVFSIFLLILISKIFFYFFSNTNSKNYVVKKKLKFYDQYLKRYEYSM